MPARSTVKLTAVTTVTIVHLISWHARRSQAAPGVQHARTSGSPSASATGQRAPVRKVVEAPTMRRGLREARGQQLDVHALDVLGRSPIEAMVPNRSELVRHELPVTLRS